MKRGWVIVAVVVVVVVGGWWGYGKYLAGQAAGREPLQANLQPTRRRRPT